VHAIDVRNHLLPFSLLQICRAAKRMGSGEALEVWGCNPDLVRDLGRIFSAPDYQVQRKGDIQNDSKDFRLEIRKCVRKPSRSSTSRHAASPEPAGPLRHRFQRKVFP
jgi:TusA-related sulfurtransferase